MKVLHSFFISSFTRISFENNLKVHLHCNGLLIDYFYTYPIIYRSKQYVCTRYVHLNHSEIINLTLNSNSMMRPRALNQFECVYRNEIEKKKVCLHTKRVSERRKTPQDSIALTLSHSPLKLQFYESSRWSLSHIDSKKSKIKNSIPTLTQRKKEHKTGH